jgi:hypothetical protein
MSCDRFLNNLSWIFYLKKFKVLRCLILKLGNAGIIRYQQYRTDPDAGMTQMTTGKNADARLTLSPALRHSGTPAFTNSSQGLLRFSSSLVWSAWRTSMKFRADDTARVCLTDRDTASQSTKKLSYVAPFWAMLYPSKLSYALCIYAVP